MQITRVAARERETEVEERCELCSETIPSEHRHLLDLDGRELMCVCRPCSILFDRDAAGGGHYRLVHDRRLRLEGFEMDAATWAELRIPVDMAFFFNDSRAERVVAFYPGAMGATESLLPLEAWEELERRTPLLRTLEPDVEALLVNRARGESREYVVPIEDCYRLAGLIRTQWRGFTGGLEVWKAIAAFYAELDEEAKWET